MQVHDAREPRSSTTDSRPSLVRGVEQSLRSRIASRPDCQRLVGRNERGPGRCEPGKGGGWCRAPGRGGGRLGELGCGPSFACNGAGAGCFDGLGGGLSLGEGGNERALVPGLGGLPIAIGAFGSLMRTVPLSGSGCGGRGKRGRVARALAAPSWRPTTGGGGRRVTAMCAPDLG